MLLPDRVILQLFTIPRRFRDDAEQDAYVAHLEGADEGEILRMLKSYGEREKWKSRRFISFSQLPEEELEEVVSGSDPRWENWTDIIDARIDEDATYDGD